MIPDVVVVVNMCLASRCQWCGGRGRSGGGMPFARAGRRFVISGCRGFVWAFERGLGFDGVAGGMCESACITVVVEFGLLGPAHLITHLCVLEIWGILFPLVGNALECFLRDLSSLFASLDDYGWFGWRDVSDRGGGHLGWYGGCWDVVEWCGVRGCGDIVG